jgi:N-acetylglucosaminyl-diphospho-decaprenol L-rhamnosyltransferase
MRAPDVQETVEDGVENVAEPGAEREVGRPVAGGGRCAVLIVTYQSARHIGSLLDGLDRARDDGLELDVLVVDNGSTDATASIVRSRPGIAFAATGGNVGYAAAINIGMKLLDRQLPLLILNPDVVPAPGAVRALLADMASTCAGVVVPRIEDRNGHLYQSLRNEPSVARAFVDALLGRRAALLPVGASQIVWDRRVYDKPVDVQWATGAALMVAPDCREAVGDWDDAFFLYSEETDFFRRARDGGWRVRYIPAAVVRHEGGGSGTSDGLYALMVVNAVRYVAKYHGGAATAAYASALAIHQVVRLSRPQARLAVKALFSGRARRGLPGPVRAG